MEKKRGSHTGSYGAFCIAISPFLNRDGAANEILVKVDNSYNENIAPLSADFTFYGGIYREVSLIAANDIHFSLDDNASKSIFISTPVVNKNKAVVNVKGSFTTESAIPKQLIIAISVSDKSGRKINEVTAAVAGQQNGKQQFNLQLPDFKSPHLWSPEDPYLYTVTAQIKNAATGTVLDEVKNTLGFRWFNFDAGKGFFLNGKSYKLIGMSRHQDYKGMGNAVSKKLAVEDVRLIKKGGANFFRIAHYPQDPAVLAAVIALGC
ncbi:MAG: glycoside hydrolase family 2 TIM barrel-domain containing protein [Ferruginibacter sp.]